MQTLKKIQIAIREQKYQISLHGNEEMSEDNLASNDIENIINTGAIMRKYTRDPRGTRYEIEGDTLDGRRGRIVCRFLTTKKLRIITAYELQ